jgi:hypothetical protein
MSQRMIDRLLHEGSLELDRRSTTYQPWALSNIREEASTSASPSLFHDAAVLVVDAVTRYLYAVSAQEDWGPEQFPHCAPPFPTFWMETRAPASIRSGATVRAWDGPASGTHLRRDTFIPQ